MFFHAVITFRNICMEHFGASPMLDITVHLHILALHASIACARLLWMSRLSSCRRPKMRRSSPLKILDVIMP